MKQLLKYIFLEPIIKANQIKMKNTLKTTLLIFSLFVCTGNLLAQSSKKDEMAKAISEYFFLERENIHAQFDKSTFLTTEKIWFKGYTYHRKKSVPFFSTTNVYVSLIDIDGKILQNKLLYGNLGSFSGNFKLDDTFKSGKYYVQFYTNWMNNFTEDESFVYEVNVINEKDGEGTLNTPNLNAVKISLNPEGGYLLKGVPNTVGVTVSDCNNNPLPISVIDVADSAGNVIQKVQLNKMGNGKFMINLAEAGSYKVIATIGENTFEELLPEPKEQGITLEVNNYAVEGKTVVKLYTNQAGVAKYGSSKMYLVVHQDEKAVIYDINLEGGSEKTVVLPSADLFDGINTIRVIDDNLRQVAERIIYKYPDTGLKAEISKSGQEPGVFKLKGKVNKPNMNISIAMLPEKSQSAADDNDIYGSLLIAPYIKDHKKIMGKHYFTTLSKGKHYELDLMLINQQSKYEWWNILKNPPKSNYTFDMGLTLKGKLPGRNPSSRVRMFSTTDPIEEMAAVDDKSEFLYENLVISDSALVVFTVLKPGQKPKEVKVEPQILNSDSKYNKSFKPTPVSCTEKGNTEPFAFVAPQIYDETIQLDEVVLEAETLKYGKRSGNLNLRGYKITERDQQHHNTILNFLRTYSNFIINDNSVDVTIFTRGQFSLNAAQPTPIVYLDDIIIYDYNILRTVWMDQVDEVYINSHAIVPSVRNFLGVIKIYLNPAAKSAMRVSNQMVVKNGFTVSEPFENVIYTSTNDQGYENFGLIDWEPTIMTDENGEFEITVPQTGQKNVKFIIEGFSADGKLISDVKTINLN